MDNIIWVPYITYPLIEAIVPVNFKWGKVCDRYNRLKGSTWDPMNPLQRVEGGFYVSPNESDSNGAIRQLRRIGAKFTPMTYQSLSTPELTLLCQVLNEFCPNSFKISYEQCPQCSKRDYPIAPLDQWCTDCQEDYQDEEQDRDEQNVRDIKLERQF